MCYTEKIQLNESKTNTMVNGNNKKSTMQTVIITKYFPLF